jgi:hypothetical protein
MLDVKKVKYHPSPNLKKARWYERRLFFKGKLYPVKNLLVIAISLLLIVTLAVYFLLAYKKNQSDPNLAIQKETKELTGRIGRFMELPLDEQPTLATVTDQDKLKGQDFFVHAQNGDKLLVWPVARKAILFRPSTGKIIEVSNLVSEDKGQSEPSPDTLPNTENSSP